MTMMLIFGKNENDDTQTMKEIDYGNSEIDGKEEMMNGNYQMMKDDQLSNSHNRKFPRRTRNKVNNIFYSNINKTEGRQVDVNNNLPNLGTNHGNTEAAPCEFFTNSESRHTFLQQYHMLNTKLSVEDRYQDAEDQFYNISDSQDREEATNDDDILDVKALFGWGLWSREQELSKLGLTADDRGIPAISDIRNSSMSYMVNGKVLIKLPTDRVRLVVDENMDPGILSVENNADDVALAKMRANRVNMSLRDQVGEELFSSLSSSPSLKLDCETISIETSIGPPPIHYNARNKRPNPSLTELNYVLTLEPDLYRRVLSEAADNRMPCGLFYCCDDDRSKNVNIRVAIGILSFAFGFILWGICIWPE